MEKIVYVTGNYGKYVQVKRQFEQANLDIDFYHCDLEEPDINDIKYISKAKVKEAYDLLKKPCFVADSGFYIEAYPENPGYPGAFVKRSGVASNIDKLLKDMKEVKNRNCKFLDCLTFYDGKEYYQFFGERKGVLSYERKGDDLKQAKSNLWYVFIPKNSTKTLAQMTEGELDNKKDGHTSATEKFIMWYRKNILCYTSLEGDSMIKIYMKDIVANALIEVENRSGRRYVTGREINNYKREVISNLKARDIRAKLELSKEKTQKFETSYSDYFSVYGDGYQLNADKDIDIVIERFRKHTPYESVTCLY